MEDSQKVIAAVSLILVGVIAAFIFSSTSLMKDTIADIEGEMYSCIESGYTIVVKGEVSSVLPKDWMRWSYSIDHNARCINFFELRQSSSMLFMPRLSLSW